MTPRLPRDISGHQLAQALSKYGYSMTRPTGSHLRLTTNTNGRHRVTIPAHESIKVGTLSGILGEISRHLDIPKSQLINTLFS